MTTMPRVRRHTSGRIALRLPSSAGPYPWMVPETGQRLTTEEITTWCELLVAPLPEPDGWADVIDDQERNTKAPYWKMSIGCRATAFPDGVDCGGLEEDLDSLHADALKMLAAVAACERYRAERQAVEGRVLR